MFIVLIPLVEAILTGAAAGTTIALTRKLNR